jgi:hypothetical protein
MMLGFALLTPTYAGFPDGAVKISNFIELSE